MNPTRSIPRPQTPTERANLSAVCRHLALVAVDGATREVADTLSAHFRLHVDQLDTDRWGYLALIEANHAACAGRPPLGVAGACSAGQFVTAQIEPRCVARYRLTERVICEAWLTTDWHASLLPHTMF